MTRESARKWLIVVVALPLLSALAGLPAVAWGPYTQAVIADRAAEALGTPNGTEGPDFINTAVVAKGWEYTDRAYVKLDPAFTHTMAKFGSAATCLPQVLAWGSTQAAEKTGDEIFFIMAAHPYDRWLLELMVDASLMNSTSEQGTGDILETLGVACRPGLLAGTSKLYCGTRSPAAPFSAQHALQRAEMQALAMIAEQVVITDEHFQANAKTVAPVSRFEGAVSASVSAAIDYIAFGILEQPDVAGEIGSDIDDYPAVLLSKAGSVLCAYGDAVFDLTVVDGVARYKIDIVTGRCNEILRNHLKDVAAGENEHPALRQLAQMLLDAMTPEIGARSFIDS